MWIVHAGRLMAVFLTVLLVGWLIGQTALVLTIFITAYLGWQIFNIGRLHYWLQHPGQQLPESFGVWAEIFNRLRSLERQSQQQDALHRNMIAEFQNLTNALPDATLVIDGQDNITWCNNTAVSLLGLKIPDDLGQAITNLLRGPDFAAWLASGDRANNRLEMPSPLDDNRWWHVTSVPFQQDQWLIVLRDITQIHNVERIRRDFVANISHELRTPVTVLLGYLELLQNHPDTEVSSAVERMYTQTVQMKALLDDLLELSRLQSDEIQGEEQDVDIAAMLEQLKEQAEEISNGKHTVRFVVESGLFLRGVAADLESVFRNLIINAIRYTPENGSISVSWQNSDEGPVFAVKDTGIGIPKRDLPRLTERFYRVGSGRARQSGGTGLGLAIVKHVINAHRAKLIISSELGEGSEFKCIFPPERRQINQPELFKSES